MRECPFKRGEYVRLKKGKSPMVVRGVQYIEKSNIWMIQAIYLSSLGYHGIEYERKRFRAETDFVLYDQQPEKEPIMNDLYQTKEEKPRFGTMLTKNSAGHIVLEMKGENGKVDAFKPEDVEIVLPYTVSISQVGNTGNTHHLATVEGQLAKDDLLLELESNSFWRVTGLNTKHRNPVSKKRHFWKLAAEQISIGE